MLKFNKRYFAAAMVIFAIEVLIALFVTDDFVRPYVGDVLVVILLYCVVKSVLRLPVFMPAMLVLLFSFMVEFLQYVQIVEKLGLEDSTVAGTVLGTSFVWMDFVAYMAGIAMVLVVEKYLLRNEWQ